MVIKMVMRMVTEMVMWACVALGTYDSLSPSVKRDLQCVKSDL
jgi:hypothetical protein